MIYEVEYQYDEGMLPEERSVTVCQLHAEYDLWATRYKLAKAARDLARELADEIEKWDYSVSRLSEVREKAERWERAVEKIKAKYEMAKVAYENYFDDGMNGCSIRLKAVTKKGELVLKELDCSKVHKKTEFYYISLSEDQSQDYHRMWTQIEY